jgi:hypothetical protein
MLRQDDSDSIQLWTAAGAGAMASSLDSSDAPSLTSPSMASGLPSFWRFSISFFKFAMSLGLERENREIH